MKDQSREILKYLRKSNLALKLAMLGGPFLGTIFIAVGEWFKANPDTAIASIAPNLFFAGLGLSALGTLLILILEQTPTTIITSNIGLEDKVSEQDKLIEFFDEYSDSLLARLSLNSLTRELLETELADGDLATEKGLAKASRKILTLLETNKSILFDMQDDYWNFSVYRYYKRENVLKCIACRRPNPEDEVAIHRDWEPGKGHVGIAFSQNSELIFSDSTRHELKTIIGARGDNERAGDTNRYVSLASLPISTDGVSPLGILIATSDVAGRFKNESEYGEEDWGREDALRDIAGALAIIFQAYHTHNSEEVEYEEAV